MVTKGLSEGTKGLVDVPAEMGENEGGEGTRLKSDRAERR